MPRIIFSFIVLIIFVQALLAQMGMPKELTLVRRSQAISNDLSAFGPVKTIRFESFSVKKVKGKWVEDKKQYRSDSDFSLDKSRIKSGFYPGGEKMFRKELYTFDSNGKLTNWELFELDERQTGTKSVYEYNKNGRISVATHYLLGVTSYKETFSYPKKRRITVLRHFFQPDIEDEAVFNYDSKGNIIEINFPDGDVVVKRTYKYDSKGNPTMFSSYDSNGKLYSRETYRYEYDKQGNWTKMIKSEFAPDRKKLKLEPMQIHKRSITYY